MHGKPSGIPDSPDYRSLFETAPSAHLVLAADAPRFTIVDANTAYLRATGTERAAIVGRGLFEVFPDNPDDPRADGVRNLRASLERVSATRQADAMAVQRYDIRRPDGAFEERHWSALSTPVFGPDGAVTHILHMFEDVTAGLAEHRRPAKVLRASEARFRDMADHAPVMMWLTDASGRCTYLNRRWHEFTGQAEEEALSLGWLDAVHPDDKARAEEAFLSANAGRAPFRVEYRLRRSDGSHRWVIDAASPRFGGAGGFLGHVGSVIDIDERRGAEEETRRYRALIEQSSDFIGMADLAGKAIFTNEGARRMVGAPEGFDWAEVTVLDFFLPEDRAFVAAEILPELLSGRGWAGEMRFRHFATGEPVPVWYDAFPIKDGAGRVAALATVTRGIGERKCAEARLRESEARFRHMADSAPALIWMTDAEGRVTFANMHYDHLFGRPAAEMLGRGWEGIVLPEDLDRHYAAFLEAFHARVPFRTETRVRDKAGQVRWLRCEGVPRLDDAGTFLGYTGCNVDITDAKAAEAALREGEARFRAISDSIDPMVWSTRPDGFHDYYNQRWYDYTGVPRGSTDGEAWNGVFHPEDQERAWATWRRSLATGEPYRIEYRLRHRSGQYRWVLGRAQAVRGEDGRITRWFGTCTDIQEIVEAREVLARSGEELEREVAERTAELLKAEEALRQAQKMEAVGQLTGGVAHDFNNLLTIIRSASDLLRRPDLAEERRRRYVDAIADTVERASRITGQLLAFARRQALKPEVFDAADRVRAVADMLRTIMGARTRIVTEIACEHCLVEADASQFETALVNMAVNARDAIDGAGTLTVRVEGVSRMPPIRGHGGGAGAFVAVSLADTGAGIAPDKLARIFEPFFTTKEVGKGTGLGLSQVYGFAKQSGGDVAVESTVGQGATFTLYLPRVDRGAAPGDASTEASGAAPAEDGRGRRVLVVEDNVEVGAFSTQVLQDLGYETTWAANADEALARLDEGLPVDVVFSDVVMPGMSGVELGHEIRRRRPGLPVVLTSGYSHVLAEEGRHGFELLQKPYAAEELSRVLLRATRGRNAR